MKIVYAKLVFSAILAGISIIYSCKEEKVSPVEVSSVWVESKDRADTIVFHADDMFELKRGKELSGSGFLLPKIRSGLYTYSVKQDSIRVNYTLSSMYTLKYYALEIQNNKLLIGDFFQKNAGQTQILIFERMN